MNHKARREVGRKLRKLRSLLHETPEGIAKLLGWPVDFYERAELGREGLSEGQQNDFRRVCSEGRDKAAIRDRLRSKSFKVPRIGP